MRIVVSGGGSAGHITPILATVDALKSLDKSVEILYVGSGGGMEQKIAKAAGLEFAAISAGKLRRYGDLSWLQRLGDVKSAALNLRDSGRLVKGYAQSFRLLKRFGPNVVFVKGGYVGLPVGLAAMTLRIPYLIHESDIRPGLTNRVLAKWAAKIAVGFPAEKYKSLPGEKVVHTGNMVRSQLLGAHRLTGLREFKLSDKLPVVLVTGGSQGARSINSAVIGALPELLSVAQVIHLAGERDIEKVRFEIGRADVDIGGYRLFSFLGDKMGLALAAADIVVARAGANTLAELALLGKPAIIVPHPSLEDQTLNASAMARVGAIKVLPQTRLNPRSLVASIKQILDSEDEQKYLREHIGHFAVPDADRKLAHLILATARPDVEEGNGQ